MDFDLVPALLGFALVMSISPGPGNFLLLASGANFGFRRSLPLALGISFGFLTLVLAVGLGLGEIMDRLPLLAAAMKFASAAYVLWLAWKICRSRAIGSADGDIARPVSFLEAAALQYLNPKAWAVAAVVTVSYAGPANHLASLLATIALFAIVNLPAISLWAACGTALRRALGTGRRIAVFNGAMAALLVASMLPVLLDIDWRGAAAVLR